MSRYGNCRHTQGIMRHCKNNKINKLRIFVGMPILSWAGWWLGAQIRVMTAFIVSIGSMLGVYLGWRINRDYLS